jgi:hypothetical protein
MKFLFCTLALLLFTLSFCAAKPSPASPATIEGAEPRKEITIHTDNTSIGDVIDALRKQYDFEVKGLEHLNKTQSTSQTYVGDIETVLRRLLRNRNYVIVRSADNKSGIDELVILDSSFGTSSRPSPASPAASPRSARPAPRSR